MAYWIGSRISGGPNWALREPSTKRTAEWTTIVTTMSVIMAFGVSVTVGVLFGVYPAPVLDATAQSVKSLVTNVTVSIDAAQSAAAN